MIRSLFCSDKLIELAFQEIAQLLREHPLHLTTAESTCQSPAGSIGIFATVDAVHPYFG
jgi:hypothetical protein